MKILVLGAKLQGIEVIYLGKKAGYEVTVIDHHADAPGKNLADHFVLEEIEEEETILPHFEQADVVIPVIEDEKLLEKICEYGEKTETEVLFDLSAYHISDSKERSNQLFQELGLACPKNYPECGFPVIAKPDGESGSAQVGKIENKQELDQYFAEHEVGKTVLQEYLEGPSYSLEVIGDGKNYYFPQITEVVVDEDYDCKRIIAPAQLTQKEKDQMIRIGKTLAERLKIRGIFDIEVISKEEELKILEIDARFPSQTPISVYHSTGINMVDLMIRHMKKMPQKLGTLETERCCFYQQIEVNDGQAVMHGEHIMGSCTDLRLQKGLFGADEMITDYQPGKRYWKAIVIITRDTRAETEEAFAQVLAAILAERRSV